MKKLTVLFAAWVALAASPLTHAQSYPTKTIRIVVPFAVGGIADTFGRVIAQKLTDTWGQSVIVENKTGAGGNIGADFVAKSPPDGYTFVIGNIGTHAVNPFLMKSMPFDPQKDFVPVAQVMDAKGLLVVNPELPVKTIADLIAYARANPGKLSYASGGIGAQMIFATMPTVIQQARSGRLRAVATLGAKRAAATPDVPTIAETLPGFEVNNWIGLFAPAGTPMEIVMRLNAEVQKIMSTPEVEKRLDAEGAKFIASTPESFAAFQKAEAAKWGRAIQEAGIKAE